LYVRPVILDDFLGTLYCVHKKFTTTQDFTLIIANDFIINIDFLDCSKKGKILLFLQRNDLDVQSQTETVAILGAAPEVC
jgi:hypothetical protein